jgi:hypothetical protein
MLAGLAVRTKGDREFESLSLRHAVWTDENDSAFSPENAENGRNFASFQLQPGPENVTRLAPLPSFADLSLEGKSAVRFAQSD